MKHRSKRLPARVHVTAAILLLIPIMLAAALCIGVAMDETTERVYNRFYPLK